MTSCEWCSESTEEINNAYTQLDDARAERDRAKEASAEFGHEIGRADAALADIGIFPGDPFRPLAARIGELVADRDRLKARMQRESAAALMWKVRHEEAETKLSALLDAIAEHREAVNMAANRARSSDRDVLREAAEADAALYAKADKIRRGESDQYAKHFRETVARIVAELERVQSLQGMEKEGKR